MRVLIEQRGDVGLLRAWGELDVATVPRLVEGVARVTEASSCVELDLRGLTFVDHVGLRAIERLRAASERNGCRVVVRRSPAALRIARLVDQVSRARAGAPRRAAA
jgi:anti-anti-sigma factor